MMINLISVPGHVPSSKSLHVLFELVDGNTVAYLLPLNQWFPTVVPRLPRVPFTTPRGAAS